MTDDQVDIDASLAGLLANVELDRVEVFELRARRRDGGFDDLPVAEDVDDEQILAGQVGLGLHLMLQTTDTEMAVRVIGSFEHLASAYTVDLAAIYAMREPSKIDELAVKPFIEQVAMMALFPYIRQHLHDLSQRLGHPVTLPLLRAGTVNATADE